MTSNYSLLSHARFLYEIRPSSQVGKFYELYEGDADVGHRHLGLNFTHGGERDLNSKRMRCVGVPESKVEETIAKLVPLGFKVIA